MWKALVTKETMERYTAAETKPIAALAETAVLMVPSFFRAAKRVAQKGNKPTNMVKYPVTS